MKGHRQALFRAELKSRMDDPASLIPFAWIIIPAQSGAANHPAFCISAAPAALDRYPCGFTGHVAHPSRSIGVQQLSQVSRHASGLVG